MPDRRRRSLYLCYLWPRSRLRAKLQADIDAKLQPLLSLLLADPPGRIYYLRSEDNVREVNNEYLSTMLRLLQMYT